MFKWFKKERNKVVGTYDTSLLTRDGKPSRGRALYLGITAALVAVLIAVSIGIVPQLKVSPKSGLSLGYAEIVSAQGGTLDWYFTGANDNTKVASAIAALPATGGEVFILTPATGQSTINFSGTVSVPASVEIRASGMGSSVVYNGSSPCFTSTGNGTTYENLKVDAGGIDMGTTTGWLWVNVAVGTTLYTERSPNSSLVDSTLNAPTGRTDSYVIAASDSSAAWKAQADDVFTGTHDEIKFRADVGNLIDAYKPFILTMAPGNYNFSDNSGYCTQFYVTNFPYPIVINAYGAIINYVGTSVVPCLDFRDICAGGAWEPYGRLTINGLEIIGNVYGLDGLSLRSMPGTTLNDVMIKNFTGAIHYGIYIFDTTGNHDEFITMNRCNIQDNTRGIAIAALNGGAANFAMHDSVISMIGSGEFGLAFFNNAGRCSITNTVIHTGGVAGQIGLYLLADVRGLVCDNLAFENNSAVNAETYIKTEASAAGDVYINGIEVTTAGGAQTIMDVANSVSTCFFHIKGTTGYITNKTGIASIADGGTIAHGVAATPTSVHLIGSTAGDIITITSVDGTNITVAIKKRSDGSGDATPQNVYWDAAIYP